MNDDWRRMIEKRLQSLELRSAVDEVHRSNVEGRLGSIEETLKWLVRLMIGGFVTGAMAYALKGGFSLL
ncbi:MAG: pseudouridine synthase [Rhodobacteraceae bacterium]|nr:pseudouridine synthase [Paracoccaceae bacterium]